MLNLLRPALGRVLTPIGRGVARTGVTPNVITVVGTAGVATGALVLYPRGELFWGTMVITAFVLFDMLDGAVARVTGKISKWGAFLDSTMDRVADAAVFSGLALWLTGDDQRVLAGVALYCLAAGAVTSYAKARAEGLGYTCDVGFAERAERLIIVLVPTGLTGLGVPYVLAIGLWGLAAASTITVVQRFLAVRNQALAGPPPSEGQTRAGAAESESAEAERAEAEPADPERADSGSGSRGATAGGVRRGGTRPFRGSRR